MITLESAAASVPAPVVLHIRPEPRPFVDFAAHDAAVARDTFDYEDPPEVHVPDPVHVPLFNVDAVLQDATDQARKYSRHPDARLAYEVGIMSGKLKEAAALIEMLQTELQTAINDGVCNSYITAGHLDRVERTCGVVVPEGYR